jgi:hypothetical protein
MKLRCWPTMGMGTQSVDKMPGNGCEPRNQHPAGNRFDPLCASVCSPENPEMIGIAGREWQVNQKASKVRIYTLKMQTGNNIHYFNTYCRQIFNFLSIFTSLRDSNDRAASRGESLLSRRDRLIVARHEVPGVIWKIAPSQRDD